MLLVFVSPYLPGTERHPWCWCIQTFWHKKKCICLKQIDNHYSGRNVSDSEWFLLKTLKRSKCMYLRTHCSMSFLFSVWFCLALVCQIFSCIQDLLYFSLPVFSDCCISLASDLGIDSNSPQVFNITMWRSFRIGSIVSSAFWWTLIERRGAMDCFLGWRCRSSAMHWGCLWQARILIDCL